ncbi:hypothetical protein C1G87_1516 [Dehalococcoides mccartyi]|uniref:Uncharacterized protein n=1 Tax=Dehalococcoides mccartyi TaxID=61435 RepID=A0A328EJL9_9CHLR|nr:hypothetical protein C1G87_1516 [Dehalococcoides mccartyi]
MEVLSAPVFVGIDFDFRQPSCSRFCPYEKAHLHRLQQKVVVDRFAVVGRVVALDGHPECVVDRPASVHYRQPRSVSGSIEGLRVNFSLSAVNLLVQPNRYLGSGEVLDTEREVVQLVFRAGRTDDDQVAFGGLPVGDGETYVRHLAGKLVGLAPHRLKFRLQAGDGRLDDLERELCFAALDVKLARHQLPLPSGNCFTGSFLGSSRFVSSFLGFIADATMPSIITGSMKPMSEVQSKPLVPVFTGAPGQAGGSTELPGDTSMVDTESMTSPPSFSCRSSVSTALVSENRKAPLSLATSPGSTSNQV